VFLKHLIGLIRPDSGQILVGEQNIHHGGSHGTGVSGALRSFQAGPLGFVDRGNTWPSTAEKDARRRPDPTSRRSAQRCRPEGVEGKFLINSAVACGNGWHWRGRWSHPEIVLLMNRQRG
jgi:hypothetical protein